MDTIASMPLYSDHTALHVRISYRISAKSSATHDIFPFTWTLIIYYLPAFLEAYPYILRYCLEVYFR